MFLTRELLCVSLLLARQVAALDLKTVDFMMSFGDSYTASGWDPNLGLDPVVGQTLHTSSGGNTWPMFLAASTNAPPNTFFDFASAGATSSNDIVPPPSDALAPATSLVTQVEEFQQYFSAINTTIPWKSTNTLFTVWIGINDIGFTIWGGKTVESRIDSIFESYNIQINKLYVSGARRFLLMNVPPTDQSPLVQASGSGDILKFQSSIILFNARLTAFASEMPARFPGAVATLFNTHDVFTSILANPAVGGFNPSLIKLYCETHGAKITDASTTLPGCVAPISEYFWADYYHPSFNVHALLAKAVEEALTAAPNRRDRRTRSRRIAEWH